MFSKRKIIQLSIWTFLLIICVGIVLLLRMQRDAKACNDFDFEIVSKNSEPFITKDLIQKILSDNGIVEGGQTIGDLNLADIKGYLEGFPSIKYAEPTISFFGKLKVKVYEKNVAFQVFPYGGDSFFVCEDNSLIPVSGSGCNRVPIVSGYINVNYSDQLGVIGQDSLLVDLEPVSKILRTINTSPVLKAQIEQIFVKKNDEIQLIPKIGNHIIELGLPLNFKHKLENLQVFYSKGINQVGWNRYKAISLKFDNQVVCTKN